MAKNTNRVASAFAYVAALGLATGLLADQWELSTAGDVTYASEIFGGDAAAMELTLGATGTTVELALDDTITVGTKSEITVTFTLNGAVFGDTIQINDFVTTPDALEVVNGSKKDGRSGDNSVTVGFKSETEIKAGDAASITLDLSAIEGATGLARAGSKVTIGTTVELIGTAGANMGDFPIEVCPPGVAAVKADADKNPPIVAAPAVAACDKATMAARTDNVIAQSAKAWTFTSGPGGTGNIDLANRGKLAGATQLAVASFTKTPKGSAMEADGVTAFATGKGAAANVHISVSGMVRDSDTVYFDQDGTKKMDSKEALSIAGGVASKTFRLSNATSGASVYFVPDGTTAMTAGGLTASFDVEFDEITAVDPAAVSGSAKLQYNGVDKMARAYAIPNPGMNDIGNVRIKCEAGGTSVCTVFLDCNEQNGTSHFGELGDTIDAGATEVLQAEHIADVLADTLVGGVWDGRLSCDVLSASDVSVQVLVRSGDSLINNTYID